MQAVGASERMFELMDKKPEVENTGGMPATDIQGKVRKVFRRTGSGYP